MGSDKKNQTRGQQSVPLFHIQIMKWSFIINLHQSDRPIHWVRNNVMCCIRVIRHNESRLMSFPAHQLVCLGCRNRQRWCLNSMTMTTGYHSRIITLGVNCNSDLVGKRCWPTFLTELYIIANWRHVFNTAVSHLKSVTLAKDVKDVQYNKLIWDSQHLIWQSKYLE